MSMMLLITTSWLSGSAGAGRDIFWPLQKDGGAPGVATIDRSVQFQRQY